MSFVIFLLCCAVGVGAHFVIVRPIRDALGWRDDIRTSRRYLPRAFTGKGLR